MPQTAKGGNHLVRNVEDIVLFADFLEPDMIAPGRHDDAAGPHDRFSKKRPDLFRPDFENLVLEFLRQHVEELRLVHAVRRQQRVGVRDVMYRFSLVPEFRNAIAWLGTQRRSQIGGAVIGVPACDGVAFFRSASAVVMELRHAKRRIQRRRSAGCVEDMVQVSRRKLRQLFRQKDSRFVCQVDEI